MTSQSPGETSPAPDPVGDQVRQVGVELRRVVVVAGRLIGGQPPGHLADGVTEQERADHPGLPGHLVGGHPRVVQAAPQRGGQPGRGGAGGGPVQQQGIRTGMGPRERPYRPAQRAQPLP